MRCFLNTKSSLKWSRPLLSGNEKTGRARRRRYTCSYYERKFIFYEFWQFLWWLTSSCKRVTERSLLLSLCFWMFVAHSSRQTRLTWITFCCWLQHRKIPLQMQWLRWKFSPDICRVSTYKLQHCPVLISTRWFSDLYNNSWMWWVTFRSVLEFSSEKIGNNQRKPCVC